MSSQGLSAPGRENSDARKRRFSASTPLAVVSFLVAVVALILVLMLRNVSGGLSAGSCVSTGVVGPAGEAGPSGATGQVGPAGLSAYDLWLTVGNTGSLQDFLDSLVGVSSPPSQEFIGSNGVTGPTGPQGSSAYQLWLEAGNSGSPQQFLESLQGLGGEDGAAGLSAYDLWVLSGNVGTIDDFFDSLVGLTGAQGNSAFDVWVNNGGVGGVSVFLESLRGATGPAGAAGPQGTCTPGDTGPTGAAGATGAPGLSAYEVWKLSGHAGSEELFLLSLVGPAGSPGPRGSAGPQGEQGIQGNDGPAGTSGFGDSGSFWDLTTQGHSGSVSVGQDTAYPIYFGSSDASLNQGISVESGSGDAPGRSSYVTFTRPGVYNIAFSAQLLRTQGGSANTVSIWLRKNGVDEPNTNTDITLVSNGQKHVAAWNFFVPVTCSATCDQWQLMWSTDGGFTNIWFQEAQTNPNRPAIPSIILTVNQVK
ncbi:unannotated protein [freshwater metagenome]|jgi:hypothetical protein|uniref:Unannotated protein n=1 Tax=freshwater metagenome TaxID=449393 RepID=A0A6J6E3P5_9ZZZZ